MKLTKEINANIFREYDIRGIYNQDITLDVAYTIGRSFGSYLNEKLGVVDTIVGMDNRNSSPLLKEALIKGILESGVNVTDLDLVTTPMYYFAKNKYNFESGIMITASHNPKEYNGFKISFNHIGNAYGNAIKEFKEYTLNQNFTSGFGVVIKKDIEKEYLSLIKKSITLGPRKVKAVIDCGNGTGSIIVKKMIELFDIEAEFIYCDSDSDFPNHHPDPSVFKNQKDLADKVKELGYDIGIGIDGDADRVGIVDENGTILSGDIFLLIMYKNLAPKLKTNKGLFDVKCSKTLIDGLIKYGIEPVMYRTGNSYINMKMQKDDFDFGGEFSGHVYFRDKFPGFDDGIYAGLRMIELLSNKESDLSMEMEDFTKYFQTEEIKIKVTDENKFKIVEKVKEYCEKMGYKIITLDGVRVEFEDSWALVRASNTGPNLTVRFEAKTKERLESLQKEFNDLIIKQK